MLPETDTTDCSCKELYNRTEKYQHHPLAKSSSLRGNPGQFRGINCSRCRRRKPGNQKMQQHCPYCLCPPDVVRSSSGRLRGVDDAEDVAVRFDHLARDSQEGALPQSGKPLSTYGRPIPSKNNVMAKKSNSLNRQMRRNEQDSMLDAMYQDIMSSGLATEETQGYQRKLPPPIKSSRKKLQIRGATRGTVTPRDREGVGIEENEEVKYVQDYKSLKRSGINGALAKQQDIRQQREAFRNREGDELQPKQQQQQQQQQPGNDEQREQFERDKRELDDLGLEVREYEMKKERERGNEREQWDKLEGANPTDENDPLKRKVSFLPSKLPVSMYGAQNCRSPREPQDDFWKPKAASEEEYTNDRFEYAKDSRDSLSQELKDISYGERSKYFGLQSSHAGKAEEQNAMPRSTNRKDQRVVQTPLTGSRQKYIHAAGDLDLHASKSYIVNLIDRALSRELFTSPNEEKGETKPNQAQKEMCVEIAKVLQGDCCGSTCPQNTQLQKEMPDYVKHLKVLRWDYLNHIEDELKKLQDLERILDAYSPRQSQPALQSQTFSPDQKKDQPGVV